MESAANRCTPAIGHTYPTGAVRGSAHSAGNLLPGCEFGQITQDRQAHAGAADAASPRVAYEYENGSANYVRLKKIVYPTTTRFLGLLYGTGSTEDEAGNRARRLVSADDGELRRSTGE
jgi:hypothetical protein